MLRDRSRFPQPLPLDIHPSEDVTFDNRPIEDFGQRFILGDGCSDQVTAYTYCAPSINAFM
ncbi:hypothetical protein H105_01853, partial [Trichophyton soudanense CBS 452.61]